MQILKTTNFIITSTSGPTIGDIVTVLCYCEVSECCTGGYI